MHTVEVVWLFWFQLRTDQKQGACDVAKWAHYYCSVDQWKALQEPGRHIPNVEALAFNFIQKDNY